MNKEYKNILKGVAIKHKLKLTQVIKLEENFIVQFFKKLEKERVLHVEGFGSFRIDKITKKVLKKHKPKISLKELEQIKLQQYQEMMFASNKFSTLQRKRKTDAFQTQKEFFEGLGSKPLLLNKGFGRKYYYLTAHKRTADYIVERDYFVKQEENKLSNI
jgi:nucleoid DNA-binding protein